jgi:hypothetical protein
MALATFGYIRENIASDAMVIEIGQRESLDIYIRGETQALIYFI